MSQSQPQPQLYFSDLHIYSYKQRLQAPQFNVELEWNNTFPLSWLQPASSPFLGISMNFTSADGSGIVVSWSDLLPMNSTRYLFSRGELMHSVPYLISIGLLNSTSGHYSRQFANQNFTAEWQILQAPQQLAIVNVSTNSAAFMWKCDNYSPYDQYRLMIEYSSDHSLLLQTPLFSPVPAQPALCTHQTALPTLREQVNYRAFLFPVDKFLNNGYSSNVTFVGPLVPVIHYSSSSSSTGGAILPVGPIEGAPLNPIRSLTATLSSDSSRYLLQWSSVRDSIQYQIRAIYFNRSSALSAETISVMGNFYEFMMPTGANPLTSFVFAARAESGITSNIIHHSPWNTFSVGELTQLCGSRPLNTIPTNSIQTAIFINTSISNLAINRTQFASTFASTLSLDNIPASNISCTGINGNFDGSGFWVEFFVFGSNNPTALARAVHLNATIELGFGALFSNRTFYGPYMKSSIKLRIPQYLYTEKVPYFIAVNQLGLPACPTNVTRPGSIETSSRVPNLCSRFASSFDSPETLALQFPRGAILTSVHFQTPASSLVFFSENTGRRFGDILGNLYEYLLFDRHLLGVSDADSSFTVHCVDAHDYDAYKLSTIVYIVIGPDYNGQRTGIQNYRDFSTALANPNSKYYNLNHYPTDLLQLIQPVNLINATDPLYTQQSISDAFILCHSSSSATPTEWRKWETGINDPNCAPEYSAKGLTGTQIFGISFGCVIGLLFLIVFGVKFFQFKKLKDAEAYHIYEGTTELSKTDNTTTTTTNNNNNTV